MFKNKKLRNIVSLLVVAAAIKIFSLFPPLVEQYYSMGAYKYIAQLLNLLFGGIPFSMGDVLYTIAGIWFIYSLVKFFIQLFKLKNKKLYLLQGAYSLACTLLIIYILFYGLWGLNYSRLGIAHQLGLSIEKSYTTEELNSLVKELAQKTNEYRLIVKNDTNDTSFHAMKKQAIIAYDLTSKELPFLSYRLKNIKVPLYNVLGNYLGYSGYINPFTNEAHVNTRQPSFLQPFVVCHEMAHQLGYGSEDEANFVGYLTAKNSTKNEFLYSTYFQLYRYANNELYYRDSLLAKINYEKLDTLVKADIIYMHQFFEQYQNSFEKYTTFLYNQFLKSNNQPQGLKTYTQVTAWLLAYKKKYQKL